MKRRVFITLLVLLLKCSVLCANNQFYDNFIVTQYNAATGIDKNSVTIIPTKGSYEISFFDDQLGNPNNDDDFYEIVAADPDAFTLEITSGSITGGASTYFSGGTNNSSHLLHFEGEDPGTLVFNAYNGVGYDFNPIFSDWWFLVFDVRNIGTTTVELLPRIGPNGLNSSSAIYYVLDQNLNAVNMYSIAPGDTATFAFKLGGHPDFAGNNSITWDYGDNPTSRFEVGFQPVSGIGFNVQIDNVGLAIPEPSIMILFGIGLLFLKKVRKNN
ncbi:PEP-CTERM sorting domain-containing protein [bacterium]|nr:PEP-CTERM sorting domain-containing protein [bacterium]MCP5462721.1 PEP-CTERM sorting domain-containing protein [bacterium]